jgi:large subunit ribosomal protein L9
MEVILLEKVENLGNIGDQVNVKSGYGRNFLVPKGKATIATPENIAIFEARRAELEAKQAEELSAAQARADKLEGLQLSITAKSGPEGKLFGSLGTIDIAEATTAQGAEIERSEVRLPDGPLRAVGDYDIEIHLHTDLNVTIRVSVVGDYDGESLLDDDDADTGSEPGQDD